MAVMAGGGPTRRLRFEPPDLGEDVARPQVQRLLERRWEGSVVCIVAGPGFGKTTALARASADAKAAGRGREVWLGIEAADAHGTHLSGGLGQALGAPAATTLDEVLDLIAVEAPSPISLVLDDVHLLPEGSTGAEVLGRLVESLPAHAGLAMAGRRDPPVPLARLRAQGQVVDVGERELALTAEQARSLGVDRERTGGWPALVALGRRVARVSDYLWEEVVGDLDGRDRDRLGALVSLGRSDLPLLDDLVGPRASTRLETMPLVHRRGDHLEAHALWQDHLDLLGEPDHWEDVRERAVKALVARGEATEAVEVALRGSSAAVVDLALRSALGRFTTPPAARVRTWVDALATADARPAVVLARAFAARDEDLTRAEVVHLFREAADGLREEGDMVAETTARAQIIVSAYSAGTPEAALPELPRLGELAAVEPRAGAIVRLGEVAVLTATNQPNAARDALRGVSRATLPQDLRQVADYFDHALRSQLGFPSLEVGNRLAEAERPIPGTTETWASSRLREGRLEELAPLLDDTAPEEQGTRAVHQWAVWRVAVATALGRPDVARARAEVAERTLPEGGNAVFYAMMARVALAASDGSREDVEVALDRLLERFPLDTYGPGFYFLVSGPVTWLRPELADRWDRAHYGPLVVRDLDLAAAVVAAEQGDLGPVTALRWPERTGELVVALFPIGAGLLLAAAHAAGRPEAVRATEELFTLLGPAGRDQVTRWSDHPVAAIAEAAADLCTLVPAPPTGHRRLRVLGPVSLEVDGEPVEPADLRRRRVQSLLGYLAVHPRTTREEIVAALWPEADAATGRRNLRTTLNLLHGILEPERAPGEAPFFVRTPGSVVELHRRGLDTDLDELERHVAEARRAEADGLSSVAARAYRAAAELFRGDLLSEVDDADWAAEDRQRVRDGFVAAAVRGAELLAGLGDERAAVDLAQRAVAVDGWAERAHAVIVRAHRALDDPAAARTAAQEAIAALEEVGGPADPAIAELFRVEATGDRYR